MFHYTVKSRFKAIYRRNILDTFPKHPKHSKFKFFLRMFQILQNVSGFFRENVSEIFFDKSTLIPIFSAKAQAVF